MSENMYCSGQIGSSPEYRDNFDRIKWKETNDKDIDKKAQPKPFVEATEGINQDIKENRKCH